MVKLRSTLRLFLLALAGLFYPFAAAHADSGALLAARQALSIGDYTKAISAYTSVLQSERLDTKVLAQVYQERGVARHKSGAAVQAIADYTNSIWLGVLPDPLSARSFLNRAIAYVEIGELVRAKRDFDNAILKDARLADAYFGRATVVRLLGKPQESLADYTQALNLGHSQSYLIYFGRGLAFQASGARDKAAADFSAVAVMAPNFAPAKAQLAALGAPLPPEHEILAYSLEQSRKPQPDRKTIEPVASLSVADAGEILTLAGTPSDEPTGAITAKPAAGSPTILTSASSSTANAQTGLRPARDTWLAEQALAKNEHAKSAQSPNVTPDIADANAPTGSIDRSTASSDPAATPAQNDALPAKVNEAVSVPSAASSGAGPTSPAPASAEPSPGAMPNPEASAINNAKVPVGAPAGSNEPPPPQPQTVAALPSVTATAAAPKVAPARQAVGGFFAQLGAFSDPQVAQRVASDYKSRFPQFAAAHGANVLEAHLGSQGVIYRVRVGPLAGEAESRSICEKLIRAAQACVPVIPPKSLN